MRIYHRTYFVSQETGHGLAGSSDQGLPGLVSKALDVKAGCHLSCSGLFQTQLVVARFHLFAAVGVMGTFFPRPAREGVSELRGDLRPSQIQFLALLRTIQVHLPLDQPQAKPKRCSILKRRRTVHRHVPEMPLSVPRNLAK